MLGKRVAAPAQLQSAAGASSSSDESDRESALCLSAGIASMYLLVAHFGRNQPDSVIRRFEICVSHATSLPIVSMPDLQPCRGNITASQPSSFAGGELMAIAQIIISTLILTIQNRAARFAEHRRKTELALVASKPLTRPGAERSARLQQCSPVRRASRRVMALTGATSPAAKAASPRGVDSVQVPDDPGASVAPSENAAARSRPAALPTSLAQSQAVTSPAWAGRTMRVPPPKEAGSQRGAREPACCNFVMIGATTPGQPSAVCRAKVTADASQRASAVDRSAHSQVSGKVRAQQQLAPRLPATITVTSLTRKWATARSEPRPRLQMLIAFLFVVIHWASRQPLVHLRVGPPTPAPIRPPSLAPEHPTDLNMSVQNPTFRRDPGAPSSPSSLIHCPAPISPPFQKALVRQAQSAVGGSAPQAPHDAPPAPTAPRGPLAHPAPSGPQTRLAPKAHPRRPSLSHLTRGPASAAAGVTHGTSFATCRAKEQASAFDFAVRTVARQNKTGKHVPKINHQVTFPFKAGSTKLISTMQQLFTIILSGQVGIEQFKLAWNLLTDKHVQLLSLYPTITYKLSLTRSFPLALSILSVFLKFSQSFCLFFSRNVKSPLVSSERVHAMVYSARTSRPTTAARPAGSPRASDPAIATYDNLGAPCAATPAAVARRPPQAESAPTLHSPSSQPRRLGSPKAEATPRGPPGPPGPASSPQPDAAAV